MIWTKVVDDDKVQSWNAADDTGKVVGEVAYEKGSKTYHASVVGDCPSLAEAQKWVEFTLAGVLKVNEWEKAWESWMVHHRTGGEGVRGPVGEEAWETRRAKEWHEKAGLTHAEKAFQDQLAKGKWG